MTTTAPKRPRGRPPVGEVVRTEVARTRLTPDEAARLDDAAHARGLDRSTALRVALTAWADEVLGVRR